jgi:hypothetical protein
LRERLARGFEVDDVGFERAVDATPVHVANQFAVVDALAQADAIFVARSAEPALEAVAEILDAQELDGPVVTVGHQVDRPLRRDEFEERFEVAGGIEFRVAGEEVCGGGRGHATVIVGAALLRPVDPRRA